MRCTAGSVAPSRISGLYRQPRFILGCGQWRRQACSAHRRSFKTQDQTGASMRSPMPVVLHSRGGSLNPSPGQQCATSLLFRLFLYDKVAASVRKRELLGYIERSHELLLHWRQLDTTLRQGLDGPYARSIAFQLQSLEHLIRFAETEIAGAESVLAWQEDGGVPSEAGQRTDDETQPLEVWAG
jgi:hypothetical protein